MMHECKLACVRLVMFALLAAGCTSATIGGTILAVNGEPRLPLHV